MEFAILSTPDTFIEVSIISCAKRLLPIGLQEYNKIEMQHEINKDFIKCYLLNSA
jgi:hypothetical protein